MNNLLLKPIGRRRKSNRNAVAQLEMILVLPVIVCLFVLIFYVAKGSKQTHELISSCRNQSWEERYTGNNIKNVRPFEIKNPQNGLVSSNQSETIRTGMYFDRWKQHATTYHRVLAGTWDWERNLIPLNSHPVYNQSGILTGLIANFGEGALKQMLEDYLRDLLEGILKDLIAEWLPELPDFGFDWFDLEALRAWGNQQIDDAIESVRDMGDDYLGLIDIDMSGLLNIINGLDTLLGSIEVELAFIDEWFANLNFDLFKAMFSEVVDDSIKTIDGIEVDIPKVDIPDFDSEDLLNSLDKLLTDIDESIADLVKDLPLDGLKNSFDEVIKDLIEKVRQLEDDIPNVDLSGVDPKKALEIINGLDKGVESAISEAGNVLKELAADILGQSQGLFDSVINEAKVRIDDQPEVNLLNIDEDKLMKNLNDLGGSVEDAILDVSEELKKLDAMKKSLEEEISRLTQ